MGGVIRLLGAPGRRDALHSAVRPLEAVVWHFTGGAGTPGLEYVRELQGAMLSGRPGVGWHVTIPRDPIGAGGLFAYQHYEWTERVGHAGGSVLDGARNVNGRTLGVELANLGELMLRKGRWISRAWFKRRQKVVLLPKGREVFKAEDGSRWEAFDAHQLEAAQRLRDTLDTRFPGIRHVRHQDIKGGKPDTGPAFPWPIPGGA